MTSEKHSLFSRRFSFWKEQEIEHIVRSFSSWQKAAFFTFLATLSVSVLAILFQVNESFLVEQPSRGGEVREGVIGLPWFINPVLAVTEQDRDLTALIYSGLLRVGPDGEFIPDLAESYSVSEDGLTYRFILRDDAMWHDGVRVTAGDVVFTINRIQDRAIDSPRYANWEGIEVEAASEREVIFHLKQPYAPFLENATIGILPSHLWKEAGAGEFRFSNLNVEPIGSGPYRVHRIKRNSAGVPEHYELRAFKHFTLGEPFVSTLRVNFYGNERALFRALETGEVQNARTVSTSRISPLVDQGYRIETTTLPRVFGVFFNQNQQPLFADRTVRTALDIAVDKEELIEKILLGHATSIDGPIPPGSVGHVSLTSNELIQEGETREEAAARILRRGGWELNEETGILEKDGESLSFSISTSDRDELRAFAEEVARVWRDLGAEVELKIFENSDLQQNIIRTRRYDALLFGKVVGRNPDLYAFWHSSQRLDPGLNIALYANITTDKLLEDSRQATSTDLRSDLYAQFQEELREDVPAVFLYAPHFLYIASHDIRSLELVPITLASDRFLNVHEWYVTTERVWRWFAHSR